MQKYKIKMALHIYFVTLMRYIDDVTRFLGVTYAICVFWPDNNVVCLIHSCYHVFSIFFFLQFIMNTANSFHRWGGARFRLQLLGWGCIYFLGNWWL